MEHYLVAMAVTACLYAIMALGMNVIWGMAGLINLGLVGFFAVGAYTSGLLTLKLGWPIIAGVLAGTIVAALVGVAVALITVRLRGDYLAIVTLGFAETMRVVMSNELWIANGTDGLSGIPGPWRQALGPHGFNLLFLCITATVVAVLFFLFQRLSHTPFGRVLRAIREDEQVAQVAGKNVVLFKVKAFAVGSAALGLAGALYGHFTSFIAPDLFAPLLTLYIKLSLLAGGLGNNIGAVLGAVLVVFFLESTRFIVPLIPGISAVQAASLRELLIAVALLVILRFHTRGLIPEKHSRANARDRHRSPETLRIPEIPHADQDPRPHDRTTSPAIIALTAEKADRAAIYKAVEMDRSRNRGWVLLTTLRYDEPKRRRRAAPFERREVLSGRRHQTARQADREPGDHGSRRNRVRADQGRREAHVLRSRADLLARYLGHPQRPDPARWQAARLAQLLRAREHLRRQGSRQRQDPGRTARADRHGRHRRKSLTLTARAPR